MSCRQGRPTDVTAAQNSMAFLCVQKPMALLNEGMGSRQQTAILVQELLRGDPELFIGGSGRNRGVVGLLEQPTKTGATRQGGRRSKKDAVARIAQMRAARRRGTRCAPTASPRCRHR